ncbi:(Fe-S)-binding protein [Actinopolyspora mortivallis]|uniref:(Fe-S)-binding protein n=1 Tax=Actinopolyspora mortivallis TaxID=33906 RepID=UPI00037A0A40|nr:heterodisulfide reductase-related iron-sulfur binding cluster [Actinopolyspora mortivallis]
MNERTPEQEPAPRESGRLDPSAPVSSGAGGAFDAFHPPQRELIDDCVHCGFCLPACPTYELWGEEMDSPRGRIHLMETGLDGEPLSESMVEHFDNCLGCMACVTACPSGVRYGPLINRTRAQVERNHRRELGQRLLRRLIFGLFPHPRRLRALRGPLALYQRSGLSELLRRTGLTDGLPASLRTMEELVPPVRSAPRIPERVPARGERRAVVGMLTGCVQHAFFPEVNTATARVLASEGCEVLVPRGQGCCGALSEHTGREREAVAFAKRVVDTFTTAGVDYVVVNSAGCGSTLKEYARLLADEGEYATAAASLAERVRDVAELVAELGPVAERHRLELTVAYHDACHLSHGQGIRSQPRELLRSVPGLEVREIERGEICCGSAGVYNLLRPEPAAELGELKAGNVRATGAELLVTANPGCAMQIGAALRRRGERMPVAHTVQVLDAAVRGLPAETLLGRRAPAES